MKCEKLFQHIEDLYDSYLNVWEELCNIESPTRDKAGVDASANYLIEMAKARGWQVETIDCAPAGNAVCITMNPEAKAAPISISGHLDTVHPIGSFGTPAVHRDAEKIYGPGVNDCKGGVVAGFLAILGEGFTRKYAGRIVNVHPSLIPSFCGKGFYGLRVHEAALDYGVKVTGATVHFVNEIPDGGEIILQKAVEIREGDTPEILQRRVMEEAEWILLPAAVEKVCAKLAN